MVGRSKEPENSGTLVAAASPAAATRNPEVVDFEKLLSDLSAAFIRTTVVQIDDEMERWLQRIVLAMDVDRGTVVQVDPADGAFNTTHQWAREGVSAPERGTRPNRAEFYPWLSRKILAGELVVVSRPEEVPS